MSQANNGTTLSASFPTYVQATGPQWIIPLCLNCVLVLGGIFIMISLIHYGRKKGKLRRIKRNNVEQFYGALTLISVIVNDIFCLILFSFTIAYINVKPNEWSEMLCNILTDSIKFAYSFAVFFVYFFLWLRQAAFYSNNMFNMQYNKVIKVFSYTSIVFIFIGGFIICVVSSLPMDTIFTGTSCVYKLEKDYNGKNSLISGVLFLGLGQFSLFGLICYALLKPKSPNQSLFFSAVNRIFCCKRKEKKEKANPVVISATMSSTISTNGDSNMFARSNSRIPSRKTSNKVYRILKKSFFLVILSTVTDVLFLFVKYRYSSIFVHLWSIVLSANVFFNLMLVIFSFSEWKEMLSSLCRA